MRIRNSAVAVCVAIGLAAGAPPDLKDATFVARAYCLRGRTADGSRVARGIVAADPRVIPLGTRVLVSGAGSYSGEYVVRDTGRSIKGRQLDVYIPTRHEALQFGVRRVRVAVIRPLLIEPPGGDVSPLVAPSAITGAF